MARQIFLNVTVAQIASKETIIWHTKWYSDKGIGSWIKVKSTKSSGDDALLPVEGWCCETTRTGIENPVEPLQLLPVLPQLGACAAVVGVELPVEDVVGEDEVTGKVDGGGGALNDPETPAWLGRAPDCATPAAWASAYSSFSSCW